MTTPAVPDPADLDAAELRHLAAAACGVDSLVDRAVQVATEHAQAAIAVDRSVSRPVLTAMLARELRRVVDATPEGWALVTAELSLRVVERRG